MTIRTRLERLESQQPASVDRPPVIIKFIDTTDADVIGMSTGSHSVMRQAGEAYHELIARARPVLAITAAGMPVIMTAIYSDKARARGREQPDRPANLPS